MNICIILPYFGTFPAWVDVFLMSCRKNSSIDFHIITDVKREECEAPNIFFHYTTFREMQQRVRSRLKGVLPSAYKLCDYRPCYGHLFDEIIKGYEYWGYCDMDTILGDICGFLNKLHYQQYDRLFLHGHFTLYRNSEDVNSLYMHPLPKGLPPMMHFNSVKKTSYPMHYDEVGANLLCSYYGLKFCKEEVSFDVSYFYEPFRLYSMPENIQCLTVYDHGRIITHAIQGGETSIPPFESMYIHFQKRKMNRLETETEFFAITEKGFIPLKDEVSPTIIQRLVPASAERLSTPFFELEKRSKINKMLSILKKEIPVRGVMSLVTIWNIIQNNRWINMQGGDDLYTKSPWFNGVNRYQ